MLTRFLKSQAGQTAIEYLILIVVSFTLGVAFWKKMDEYFINSPNGFINSQLNLLKKQYSPGENGRYQRFPLMRSR